MEPCPQMKLKLNLKNEYFENALLSFLPYADTLLYVELVFVAFGVSFFFGKIVSAVVSLLLFGLITALVISVYYSLKPGKALQLVLLDLHLPYQTAQILVILIYRDITALYAAVLALRMVFSVYEVFCIYFLTKKPRHAIKKY
jgi:hypothetical protein